MLRAVEWASPTKKNHPSVGNAHPTANIVPFLFDLATLAASLFCIEAVMRWVRRGPSPPEPLILSGRRPGHSVPSGTCCRPSSGGIRGVRRRRGTVTRTWLGRPALRFTILSLGVLAGCSADTSGALRTCAEAESSPRAVFRAAAPLPLEHTLAPIFADEAREVTHDFRILNDTDRVIHFGEITWTCVCAGAKIDAMVLRPGEETRLHLKVDLRGRLGPQRYSSTLLNDTGVPWHYSFATTIYPRITFMPERLQFGVVAPNRAVMRSVVVSTYSRQEDPNMPSVLGPTCNEIKVIRQETSVQDQADGFSVRRTELHVQLTALGVAGTGSGLLSAQARDAGMLASIH